MDHLRCYRFNPQLDLCHKTLEDKTRGSRGRPNSSELSFCCVCELLKFNSEIMRLNKQNFHLQGLRPWQTRTHCGHIVANTNVSLFARECNICCGHKFCVWGTKNVSDFVHKHFVSPTNVSQFAQPKKHHGQQCVCNNASSITRALTRFPFCERLLDYCACYLLSFGLRQKCKKAVFGFHVLSRR